MNASPSPPSERRAAGPPVFSLCEWVLGPVPLEEVCRVAIEAGATGVHLRGDHPPRDAASLRAGTGGVPVLGITPTILWPRDRADLANPDPEVRARGVTYYRSVVDLAVDLGVPRIEVVPACEGRMGPMSSRQEEWSLAAAALGEVAAYAGERGVTVGVEPLNRYETYLVTRLQDAAEMVAQVGMENMGVVADAFHMSIEESDPEAAVRAVGPLLVEVQVADSNRRAPGLGHLDVGAIVRAALASGYAGPWVMEFLPREDEADSPADLETFRSDLSSAVRLVADQIAMEGAG